MALYYVPLYVLIDSSSPEEALKAKKAIEELLTNGFVPMALQGAGVPFKQVTVADPVIANIKK